MRPILVGACSLIAFVFCLSIDTPTASAVSNIDGDWSALDGAAAAPTARREYAAVYDRVHRRYVIFAGFTNQAPGGYFLFNQVWTLELDTDPPLWSIVSIPGVVPGGRHSPQWGYDPARNRLIVFGGYGSHLPGHPYAYLNDIWELKLNGNPSWNELTPSGTAPQGRLAGTAVFDVLHQRFVGFGGTAGLPVDTWQLDLKGQPAWSTIPTNGVRPNGGYGMTSIFDAARNRMIIFGGSTGTNYYGVHNDTWELDLTIEIPVWRQLNPGGTLPPARRSLTSIFDPVRDRMVIFGGAETNPAGDIFMNDTWALSLSTPDGEWTQLSAEGTVPVVRATPAAAYDPRNDRMVLFGGWSGTNMLGDTQFLTWNDEGASAIATSDISSSNGVVDLEWDTQNTVSTIGAVYRRQTATEWTSIGTFEADATGHVDFTDNSVTPGQEYGYQIIVSSAAGDELVGEVWTSPTTGVGDMPKASIALQVWPNPAVGSFAASFSLANNAPAQLDMFDVRGARVFSREINGLGVGAHRLEIGRATDYPSGVYFMRLTQSGTSVTSRFVVVR